MIIKGDFGSDRAEKPLLQSPFLHMPTSNFSPRIYRELPPFWNLFLFQAHWATILAVSDHFDDFFYNWKDFDGFIHPYNDHTSILLLHKWRKAILILQYYYED